MPLWNPWHGCKKISTGCKNCYVYRQDARYERDSSRVKKNGAFALPVERLKNGAYKVKPGEQMDTCFTSDFLLEEADEWRKEAWAMIRERQDLNFLFLTKRIDRFTVSLPEDWGEGYPNVTVGCTCENQDRANYRLPIFQSLPIRHKVIVCAPLLERVDLSPYLAGIETVSAAGESGTYARECDYEWILRIQSLCAERGIKFWFQQTGYRFRKDGKLFLVPRRLQHAQARKAGINLP